MPASIYGGRVQEVLSVRRAIDAVELHALAARTASASGPDVVSGGLAGARSLLLVCDVTAKAGTTPTLDLTVQAKIGANYFPLAAFSIFSNVIGTKMIAVNGDPSFATEVVLAADPAVVSGFAKKDVPWGDTFRVKYTIGGSAGQSMTFSVIAYPFN